MPPAVKKIAPRVGQPDWLEPEPCREPVSAFWTLTYLLSLWQAGPPGPKACRSACLAALCCRQTAQEAMPSTRASAAL